MLVLQNISYSHPNKDLLFSGINLTVNDHDKIALIGNNGTGKSTLLRIIANELHPAEGQRHVNGQPYYVPQIFEDYNNLTIAQALKVAPLLNALNEILAGHVTEENYAVLGNDWGIEERCYDALRKWQLSDCDLSQKVGTLSGGQKVRVFLAGISIHQPELVLLDEPSNHLDVAGRQLLYDFIRSGKHALMVVSHDRKLLNLLDTVCELTEQGIKVYGGNYDFYQHQKQTEKDALSHEIHSTEKALRKAREKERETLERQQKLDSRGKGKQEKAGVPRIMMNTLRNQAESSKSRLKSIHAEKIEGIHEELQKLWASLPDRDKMKLGLDASTLHRGKVIFEASRINYAYAAQSLWKNDLSFLITSGERIALTGSNGSGKTTFIKLLLGHMEPQAGILYRAHSRSVYIDQDYSLLDPKQKVYEQAQQFNVSALQEHEIKTRLNRFLFTKETWDKPCGALSGGERMRLMLCCLTISDKAPDLMVFDELTNNLDIQNVEILTSAINEYRGTLLVVSHDETFLEQIGIERWIGIG